MAKALFEKREFKNPQSGEIVNYESYSIVGIDSTGTRTELPLKALTPAEKIAFKMVAQMEDPINEQLGTATHKATAEELVLHQEKVSVKKDDDNNLFEPGEIDE
jgi:hypothetical protein